MAAVSAACSATSGAGNPCQTSSQAPPCFDGSGHWVRADGSIDTSSSRGSTRSAPSNSSTSVSPSKPVEPSQLPATLTQGGAQITVKSTRLESFIQLNKTSYRQGSPNAKYTAEPAGTGYKFFVVTTHVRNNGARSMDLTCALPVATRFVDKKGREFDTIDSLYKIKGNPECNTGAIQPEESAEMTWAYRIPDSAAPDKWGFVDVENGGYGQTAYTGIQL
ncbi:hypothetical protein [Amycolatopsis alba]|nr:hypothetical protein [Amycolatopsis alba]